MVETYVLHGIVLRENNFSDVKMRFRGRALANNKMFISKEAMNSKTKVRVGLGHQLLWRNDRKCKYSWATLSRQHFYT